MRTLLRFVFALLVCSTAAAVEPSIRNLNIRGLQIGGTTELVCDGDDFTTEPKLLLPFAVEQSLKAGSTEKRATFTVTLADNIEPGYYQLRVVTAGGVSQPIVIGVDRLPQQEPKTPIEKLPVAVHGSVTGSSVTEAKFSGKQGEAVTIEVEAQRFGSKLRPVLHLYDAKGKQLAWSWPQPSLFGDARLEATLPADGEYRVSCHDLEYAAPSPNYFRLKVGQWTRIDQIIPAAMKRGDTSRIFMVYTPKSVGPQSVLPGDSDYAFLESFKDLSGPRPFIRLSNHTEYVENVSYARNATPLGHGPFSMHGELRQPGEEDGFLLGVEPGDKLRCEVFAERYGSTIDARLVLKNEQDVVLARGEDSPGSLDPVLEFTVPEELTSLRVCVSDAQGRGGLCSAYHLLVSRVTGAGAGDFKLRTSLQQAALPRGGRWVVPVTIDRRGFVGPLELSADSLPAGLSLTGNTISPGSHGTLVTISADDSDSPQSAAITQWQGRTADGKSQPVLLKNHPLEMLQPWLAEEIAVARVNSAATDFSIDWRDLPEPAALQPTAKLALPIKISRIDDKTAVRLSFVSSQLVTLGNNNQPDPNKTLRVERAVELGAKMNDGEVTLLVPPDLADDAYDLAVQAELLSADKQKVLATSFTPVRRLPVHMPVEVQLAGEPKIDIMLDLAKGAMQKIEGTVKRREGITGDVTIALAGLPAGARADSPVVKADASTFSVNVVLPANQPAGEITGLNLSATIVPDPKQANARVKSREVDLSLNVIRPTP